MILEICVDSVESARAAETGGAQRVELCSDLLEGGITPSGGLIDAVRESLNIPLFVIIRPRAGDFCYSADDFRVMKNDIAIAKSSGADGVVLGLLHADGGVDTARTGELVALARPLEVTFHRAIDVSPDLGQSLERIIETGAERVLTSGGRQTAAEGMDSIRRLVEWAGSQISVMVGGSVRHGNVSEIAAETGATEFHASPRRKMAGPMLYHNPDIAMGSPGLDEFSRYLVPVDEVRSMRAAMDAVGVQSFRTMRVAVKPEK